jgi:hypothetical protein
MFGFIIGFMVRNCIYDSPVLLFVKETLAPTKSSCFVHLELFRLLSSAPYLMHAKNNIEKSKKLTLNKSNFLINIFLKIVKLP